MANLRLQHSILFFLLAISFFSEAQTGYHLSIKCVDKDEKFIKEKLKLDSIFSSKNNCANFINQLPFLLQTKGYVAASVDSIFLDSLSGKIVLFVGEKYTWAQLHSNISDATILEAIGWNEKMFQLQPLDFLQVNDLQEKIIQYLENNGYPFAKIFLDSVQINRDIVSAKLKIEKGPLYKIDSIRIFGKTTISNHFLQQHLGIVNKSLYRKEKLVNISKKILELPFIQEVQASDLNLLGAGAVLNLYLQQKKSSHMNLLVGFAPNQQQNSRDKIWVTGDANFSLRNILGKGESIGLQWQQLQQKSPRLNIFYQQPYFLSSAIGVDFNFDMLRKDSSFLNINLKVGASSNAGKLFLQQTQTIITDGGINSRQIIESKKLPDIIDLTAVSLGFEFEKNKTNYRLNPRSGFEYTITAAVGSKKLKKSNQILELKDPLNPLFDFESLYESIKLNSYQLKFVVQAAKYFTLGKQATLKTMINGAYFISDNIFRNELFQIGGYKLLRGFNEESELVSQYIIGTIEYRYLVGQNSFFYSFTDFAWAKNSSAATQYQRTYIGAGLGLAFETKAGIINLAWALGKKENTPINFKQSKLHFGFVNYF